MHSDIPAHPRVSGNPVVCAESPLSRGRAAYTFPSLPRPPYTSPGGVTGVIMSAPFVISIPHQLGKDEAVRRLKSGLGNASATYGQVFAVEEEIWTGEHLQFRIRAFGQVASGTIDVADQYVTLPVFLPWLLAKLASAIRLTVR